MARARRTCGVRRAQLSIVKPPRWIITPQHKGQEGRIEKRVRFLPSRAASSLERAEKIHSGG
jgi:hypothetical protein